jgi:primary-amine oxidase
MPDTDSNIDTENHKVSYPRSGREHPFDPLSYHELARTVQIVHESGNFRARMRFAAVTAREPDKTSMQTYKTDACYDRLVDVLIIDNENRCAIDAVVSLSQEVVLSFQDAEQQGQPPLTPDEFIEIENTAKMSELVADALRKRGLDISERGLVTVDPLGIGYYDEEDSPKRRLARAVFHVRKATDDLNYAHPVDGLAAIIDLDEREVIKVEDTGVVPVPQQMRNYDRRFIDKFREDIKPLEITQPDGPSFSVNGWQVEWQRWRLRVDFNIREGLVLRDVRYDDVDKGIERKIAYRMSIAEMTVPYGDSTLVQYRKNAFDAGEYGLGILANSLTHGCDCLGEIHYFDFDYVDTFGEIESIPNAICMHEEDDSILWKHTDLRTEKVEVRRSRKLILSFISTVGNYEYGFYWIFRQDGSIELEVKAIGVMQTGAVKPGERPKFGTLVEEGCYAPNHQHFFCARLDMNIDGPDNQVVEVDTRADPMGPGNPYGNAFYAVPTVLRTEKKARRNHSLETARYWAIQNPNVQNRMGTNVGYKILPTEIVNPFFQEGSSISKRGAYLDHHLWVTPYDRSENYPAGHFPNQNPGPDGLPVWTEKDRNIENEDIVVWYVFGHHHIPRLEDWPMMPSARLGFHLKPANFFDFCTCIDVPPSKAKSCGDVDERGFTPNKQTRRMRRDIRRQRLEEEAQRDLEERKERQSSTK